MSTEPTGDPKADLTEMEDQFSESLVSRSIIRRDETKAIIAEIRASDCGAWLSDRPESKGKRIELMKLLDRLYKAAL